MIHTLHPYNTPAHSPTTPSIGDMFLQEIKRDPLYKSNLMPLVPYIKEHITNIIIHHGGRVAIDYADGSYEIKKDAQLHGTWMHHMALTMASITEQYFDEEHPMVGFKLPGGHRCQVVKGVCVAGGFTIAIRINRGIRYTLSDYGFSKEEQHTLISWVKNKKTLLLSGGTNTGKTSLLQCLLTYIPPEERIITLEDVPELTLDLHAHPKVDQLYFSNSNRDGPINPKTLLDTAMRLNPTRIIMGEIRLKGALGFYNAINTGHEGSLATIHANSPSKAIEKLVAYIRQAEGISVAPSDICQDIYAVIQLERKEGKQATCYFEKAGVRSLGQVSGVPQEHV